MVQTKDLGATVGEHGANKGLRATVGGTIELEGSKHFRHQSDEQGKKSRQPRGRTADTVQEGKGGLMNKNMSLAKP